MRKDSDYGGVSGSKEVTKRDGRVFTDLNFDLDESDYGVLKGEGLGLDERDQSSEFYK